MYTAVFPVWRGDIWCKCCNFCRSIGRLKRRITGRVGSRKSGPFHLCFTDF